MKDTKRPNLKIIGDNIASGGKYGDARIIGNSVVDGDLDCFNFKSVGDSKVNGNIEAGQLKTIGSITIAGSAKSESVVVTGNLDATGDLTSDNLVIRGGIYTKGNLKAGNARLTGYVTVNKSCEADTFRADAQLKIDGLLSADDIIIRTYGTSKISEIGGDKITIMGKSMTGKMLKLIFMSSGFSRGKLITNSIEGDDIRLSNTKAKVVRGNTVVIENECDIDLVEYKENLRVHRNSSVKEKKKI